MWLYINPGVAIMAPTHEGVEKTDDQCTVITGGCSRERERKLTHIQLELEEFPFFLVAVIIDSSSSVH